MLSWSCRERTYWSYQCTFSSGSSREIPFLLGKSTSSMLFTSGSNTTTRAEVRPRTSSVLSVSVKSIRRSCSMRSIPVDSLTGRPSLRPWRSSRNPAGKLPYPGEEPVVSCLLMLCLGWAWYANASLAWLDPLSFFLARARNEKGSSTLHFQSTEIRSTDQSDRTGRNGDS